MLTFVDWCLCCYCWHHTFSYIFGQSNKFLLCYPNNWVVFRTQITQIKRIVSLALVIYICGISNICGYIFSNTDYTDWRDYIAYARDEYLWNPEYLWFIYLNTDCTNLRDYLAYARDEYLGDRYFFSNTDHTDLRDISLALGMSICDLLYCE